MEKFKKEEIEGEEGHGEEFGIAFGFAIEANEEMANVTIHGPYSKGASFAFLSLLRLPIINFYRKTKRLILTFLFKALLLGLLKQYRFN